MHGPNDLSKVNLRHKGTELTAYYHVAYDEISGPDGTRGLSGGYLAGLEVETSGIGTPVELTKSIQAKVLTVINEQREAEDRTYGIDSDRTVYANALLARNSFNPY